MSSQFGSRLTCIWLILQACCVYETTTFAYEANTAGASDGLHGRSARLEVDIENVIHEVDKRFISVAFDSSLIITHWTKVNFASRKFCTLLSGLSPVHLRVGGSSSNFLLFSDKELEGQKLANEISHQDRLATVLSKQDDCHDDFVGNFSEFYMTRKDFDTVNRFVHDCGDVRMLFVLNPLLRKNQSSVSQFKPASSGINQFKLVNSGQDKCRPVGSGADQSKLAEGGVSLFEPVNSVNKQVRSLHFQPVPISPSRRKHLLNSAKSGVLWGNKNTNYIVQNHWVSKVGAEGSLLPIYDNIRNDEGVWNYSNAESLLKYCAQKNYSEWMDFELGNEPSSFQHAFNKSLSAEQLACDYAVLKQLLSNFSASVDSNKGLNSGAKSFSKSIITGPAVTQPKKQSLDYLSKFLKSGAAKLIDAITIHHYYTNGRTATLEDMMSVTLLDTLRPELHKLWLSIKRASPSHKLPVWLGETASCFGGGAPGLSDRYVAGFMWLDKLGIAASNNISVVIRQSLRGSCYQLVDKNINPNPDYWLTWLYRRLVGRRVLRVMVKDDSNHSAANDGNIRFYAHCANNQHEGYRYPDGAVTFYGMNLGKMPMNITLPHKFTHLSKHLYWILPYGGGGLISSEVTVSGRLIRMINDTSFMKIEPVILPAHSPVTLPATSFGFIVVPDAEVSACLTNG